MLHHRSECESRLPHRHGASGSGGIPEILWEKDVSARNCLTSKRADFCPIWADFRCLLGDTKFRNPNTGIRCRLFGGLWRIGRHALSGRRIRPVGFCASGGSRVRCGFGRLILDSPASCKRPERNGSGRGGGSDCRRFVRSVVGQSTQAARIDGCGPQCGSDCQGGLVRLDGKAYGVLRELSQNASDERVCLKGRNADR